MMIALVRRRTAFLVPLSICFSAFALPAEANKCFRASSFEELKRDFPVVIRGEVVKRTRLQEKRFELEIKIVKSYQGQLKIRNFKTLEDHYSDGMWRVHALGKQYTFVLKPGDSSGNYVAVLPADGCPELPAPSNRKE